MEPVEFSIIGEFHPSEEGGHFHGKFTISGEQVQIVRILMSLMYQDPLARAIIETAVIGLKSGYAPMAFKL